MLPLALSVLLFLFFFVTGSAIQAVLGLRLRLLQRSLLAPATGLAATLLAITFLNQAGLPVENFARGLLTAGLILAAAAWWWRRPRLPWAGLRPFGLLLLFSLVYTGWPALSAGFDWVSYANDDMANYCLGAQRFLHNGFFRLPTPGELGGTDYSQYYWFMHVAGLMRFGSEILLAWVAGWTRLSTLQIFMPVIITLSLVQISATAALALASGWGRRVALGAAALLAVSPAFLMGTYYQLIAQVGGLALLAGLGAFVLGRSTANPSRRDLVRLAATAGLVTAALGIFYPEVSAFAWLGYAVFVGVEVTRTRRLAPARLLLPAGIVIVAIVLLRYNVFTYLVTLGNQAGSGMAAGNVAWFRFPFYLVPSGLSNAFGFTPLAQLLEEPWNSVFIAAGLLLLLTVAWRAVRDTWRGTAHGAILLCMLGLGVMLFIKRSDFGLFKIAMFMQPFVACCLAAVFFAGGSRRWIGGLVAGIYCALQVPTGWHYASVSLGLQRGQLIELPGVSQLHMHRPEAPGHATLFSDAHNPVVAKFSAAYLAGQPLYFLSYDYFNQLAGEFASRVEVFGTLVKLLHPHAAEILQARDLMTAQRLESRRPGVAFGSRFVYSAQTTRPSPDARLLGTSVHLDILNGDTPLAWGRDDFFATAPRAQAANYLVFVPSSRGQHYYTTADPKTTSFYQVERDYFNPRGVFSALGRFVLLRVENPTEQVYLRVALTKSVMGPGHTVLGSHLRVLGQEAVAVPLPGAGAANVYAGPLRPLWLDGAAYVAVDFGEDGVRIEGARQGLMSLYNLDIPVDWRLVNAFGRNLACVSPEAFARLARPRSVQDFPADMLREAGLEYSGWFEDGWISRQSCLVLGRSQPDELVRLRGEIPDLGAMAGVGQSLSLRINGGAPQVFNLPPGAFDVQAPVTGPGGLTRVELEFSRDANLPGLDGRPVAAKIAFVGLTAK